MQCTQCLGEQFTRAGRDRQQRQVYRCRACGRRMTTRSPSAFRGYRFPDEVIALAVRWYLRYRLSYADVAEWLAERGITVDPSTIYDWVRAFTSRFSDAARVHRSPVGGRWMRRTSRLTDASATCFGRSMSTGRSSMSTSATGAIRPLPGGFSKGR